MGTDRAFDLSSKRRHHAPRQTYYLLLHRGCFFTRQPRRPRPNAHADPYRRFDKLSNLVPFIRRLEKRAVPRAGSRVVARLYASAHLSRGSGVKADWLYTPDRLFAHGDRARPA